MLYIVIGFISVVLSFELVEKTMTNFPKRTPKIYKELNTQLYAQYYLTYRS